jgi:hypothetical protein
MARIDGSARRGDSDWESRLVRRCSFGWSRMTRPAVTDRRRFDAYFLQITPHFREVSVYCTRSGRCQLFKPCFTKVSNSERVGASHAFESAPRLRVALGSSVGKQELAVVQFHRPPSSWHAEQADVPRLPKRADQRHALSYRNHRRLRSSFKIDLTADMSTSPVRQSAARCARRS